MLSGVSTAFIISSAVSAITLLAHPVEIYLYGLQYLMIIISFIPFNLILAYFYIPVYFQLNVKSAYEVGHVYQE